MRAMVRWFWGWEWALNDNGGGPKWWWIMSCYHPSKSGIFFEKKICRNWFNVVSACYNNVIPINSIIFAVVVEFKWLWVGHNCLSPSCSRLLVRLSCWGTRKIKFTCFTILARDLHRSNLSMNPSRSIDLHPVVLIGKIERCLSNSQTHSLVLLM